jgi:hypothetical protein
MIGVLTVAASQAGAAIIYSGILELEGPDLSIDIDGDGSADFETEWVQRGFGNGYAAIAFDAEHNSNMRYINDRLFLSPTFPGTKVPLDHGHQIGPAVPSELLWASSSNDAMMWITIENLDTTYSGLWNDVTDKYLGFGIEDGDSNLFYGWIRLDTDVQNNITLVDYAYQDVPGASISAGAIPEPSTALLVSLGLTALAARRRRTGSFTAFA